MQWVRHYKMLALAGWSVRFTQSQRKLLEFGLAGGVMHGNPAKNPVK